MGGGQVHQVGSDEGAGSAGLSYADGSPAPDELDRIGRAARSGRGR